METDHQVARLLREAEAPCWFCVVTPPKHESVAAASLLLDHHIDVLLPRARVRRRTRGGGVAQVVEPLFPGYLFARFCLLTAHRRVKYARGVKDIVHFGNRWPVVPETSIDELRQMLGAEGVIVLSKDFRPGDSVEIVGGAFHGLGAIVEKCDSSKNRIKVLLEFLGRQTALELPRELLLSAG